MGIYIPDMGMPKDGYRQLFLTAEGEVTYFPSTPKNGEVRKKAIPVPPHGDLIDRRVANEAFYKGFPLRSEADGATKILFGIPTVIPAEPPKEET